MSWEYRTKEGQIGLSVAVEYWCWRCKVQCLKDNLMLKFYCPNCGDEWSEQTAVEIGDKRYAKIKLTLKHFVNAKNFEDLKLKLKNKRVIYTDKGKMTPKKYLEFVKSFWNIEYQKE